MLSQATGECEFHTIQQQREFTRQKAFPTATSDPTNLSTHSSGINNTETEL